MKKSGLITAAFIIAMMSSCVKDKNFRTYTITRTEYAIKPEVKEAARLQPPRAMKEPGSFALYNNLMFVNEKEKGIHVFDYSNAANPVNKGFIPIPGNLGISIKDDILYADCFIDLFVFRVFSGEDIQLQNSVANVFPERVWRVHSDTSIIKAIVIKKDTTVTEEYYNSYAAKHDAAHPLIFSTTAQSYNGGTSVGSSMAVFTIVKDHLYTVSNYNLNTFSITDKLTPLKQNTQYVAFDVETIFPFKDKLFIGSMTGMFIYSIDNPAVPVQLSRFAHARVCDPVIADDRFAFVTLRSGSACGGFTNQLDVVNIENVTAPALVKTYPFANPHGLSKDGNILFVCDGTAGLKVLDATDTDHITLKKTLNAGKAIDVVALKGKAFVMLDNAIQIYSYDDQFNVQLLSDVAKF